MPVDPQLRPILDASDAQPPLDALSVEEARARLRVYPLPGARADAVASVVDRGIPGPGGPLGLRVHTPLGAGPFPLLVFFHGGGFVVCGLGTHDALCRNLCARAGCAVASVDYRFAPEHRFPAAPDDCLAATRWAAGHAAELGADPARAWRWAATAPGAIWRRWSRCARATRAARASRRSCCCTRPPTPRRPGCPRWSSTPRATG
jgi:acetyl esterase